MQASTKFVSIAFQVAVIAVTALIIFRTISEAGIVLYTFHPTLMAIGVSIVYTTRTFIDCFAG
jgi:hypothetical protein